MVERTRHATLSIAVAVALCGPSEVRAETETRAPYTVIREGRVNIGVREEVGDLLVVGARAELAGVVRGHVYAVDADVVVRSTAVVLRSMTVVGGSMAIEDGAVLPEELSIAGTRIEDARGQLIPQKSGPMHLGRSSTTLHVAPAKSSTMALELMKSVLPFDRFVPPADRDVARLAGWHPGLGLELVHEDVAPRELVVGGLARLSFVTPKVKGALQRGYRGARGSVLFSLVKLEDRAAAEALWAELERAAEASKVALSVRTALGDGAHWYFKRKGRHVLLWQRDAWLVAVETKLAADGASIRQERQFSEQVLTALRSSLAALEGGAARPAPKSTVEGATR